MAKSTTTASMFDFDASKFLSTFKVPSVNFEAAMVSQRKNIEALTEANKLAFEGVQALARRQGEMMTESVEDFTGALSDLAAPGSFEEKAGKQAEFAKSTYQKVLSNFWELGELMTKSNSRAFGIINKRVTDSLDEVKSMVSSAPSGE